MANIMIGMQLRSVKNDTTATVTSIDKKYKTALIEFDDGMARSYSLSTLNDKRQWVIVTNDNAVESAQKQDSEALEQAPVDNIMNDEDDIAGDGTPLAEVGKEIAKQAKEKANAIRNVDLMSKFVKKAQKIITNATHDQSGYHVTIVYNNKTKSFDDKNLQNIRSAIGHIYRGEVAI